MKGKFVYVFIIGIVGVLGFYFNYMSVVSKPKTSSKIEYVSGDKAYGDKVTVSAEGKLRGLRETAYKVNTTTTGTTVIKEKMDTSLGLSAEVLKDKKLYRHRMQGPFYEDDQIKVAYGTDFTENTKMNIDIGVREKSSNKLTEFTLELPFVQGNNHWHSTEIVKVTEDKMYVFVTQHDQVYPGQTGNISTKEKISCVVIDWKQQKVLKNTEFQVKNDSSSVEISYSRVSDFLIKGNKTEKLPFLMKELNKKEETLSAANIVMYDTKTDTFITKEIPKNVDLFAPSYMEYDGKIIYFLMQGQYWITYNEETGEFSSPIQLENPVLKQGLSSIGRDGDILYGVRGNENEKLNNQVVTVVAINVKTGKVVYEGVIKDFSNIEIAQININN